MTKVQMERIALNILTCITFRDAAKKSGITESALYRIRHRKGFQQVLSDMKNKMFGDTMLKAQAYSLEALDVLRAVMNDKRSNDTAKVSAARAILEMSLNAYALEEVETKIERLEQLHGIE